MPAGLAAVLAGLAAGIIAFVLLQLAAVAIYDESPWKLPRMLAAVVRGPGALQFQDEYDAGLVAIGLAVHFCLAVASALVLALLVRETPARLVSALGIAFGVALYFACFHGLTSLFPWFAADRTPDTLAICALFGLVLARWCHLTTRLRA